MSILSFSCTKEKLRNDKADLSSSLTNTETFTNTERSITSFGSEFVQALGYVNNYEQQIFDTTQYCPFEFTKSGRKIYDSNIKLKNRVINYYDSIGYDVNGRLYDQFILNVEEYEYADLPRLGISSEEIVYIWMR